MINAIPITSTTIPPATKLEIKFANEGVIYKIPFFKIIKLKIVRLTTLTIVSTFKKKYN
jgi:hypothetical protein